MPLRGANGRFVKGEGRMTIAAAKGKATVQDVDHGWKRISEQLKNARHASTKIGIQAGTERKAENGDGENPETDMVAIAAWNEFGTEDKNGNPHIPPRPAHAKCFDDNRQQMNRHIERAYSLFLEGKWELREAIGKVGEKYQFLLQATIKAFSDPPNAPATIEAKGADNPLINFGQMVNSIRHVEDFGAGQASNTWSKK